MALDCQLSLVNALALCDSQRHTALILPVSGSMYLGGWIYILSVYVIMSY